MSSTPPSSLDTKTPPPTPTSSSARRILLSPKLSPLEEDLRNLILSQLSKVGPLQDLLKDPLIQAELSSVIDEILLGLDKMIRDCEECLPSCWDKFMSKLKSCFRSSPSPPGGPSKSS